MATRFYSLFALLVALFSLSSNAQIIQEDSLKGFNEAAFIQSEVSRGISGTELKDGLRIAKKEHIYSRYYQKSLSLAAVPSLPHVTVVQPACTNMDFETGTFYGWDLSSGTILNSQTLQGCCPTQGAPESVIINTSSTPNDPMVSILGLASPLGGNYIARINDVGTNAKVNRISQTFSVTTSNSVFMLAYAGVLQSSGNHICNVQPGINVMLWDTANSILPCPQVAVSAPGSNCIISDPLWFSYGPGGIGGHYRNWSIQTIDLREYIGTSVTLQITVSDCTATGHYGYAYFDMKCVPMEINLDGNFHNAANRDSVYLSSCNSSSIALIGVPEGLGPYLWDGPPGSTATGATTSTISTNIPGIYTVTMTTTGACPRPGNPMGSIIKHIVLGFSAVPTISITTMQPSCANASGSAQVNVTGPAPFSYSWTPAVSNTANVTGLVPGSDYTVTTTDAAGCIATASLSVNPFPDAPTFTISPLNGVLTCASPSLTLSALTGTNTTAAWASTTSSSLNVFSPGTYSVTLTNTASVGQCSTTVHVAVTSNTVLPTANYSLSCGSGTVSLVATSQPGVALGWLEPTLPMPTPVSNPGVSAASGIFTLTATDLSNGCQRTYTASSVVNLSVTPTATTICPGQVVVFHASGAPDYIWMPASVNGATYSVSPTTSSTYTVMGTTGYCVSSPLTLSVTVATCTGLEDLVSKKEVIVYPNPSSGVFTISCSGNTGKLDVTVINVLGQAIKTEKSKNPASLVVDLSTYSKGIYYLKIDMNDGFKIMKVMLD